MIPSLVNSDSIRVLRAARASKMIRSIPAGSRNSMTYQLAKTYASENSRTAQNDADKRHWAHVANYMQNNLRRLDRALEQA